MSPEFVIILIIKSRPVNSVVALKDWLGTLALSVMGHFLNTYSERVRTTASNVSFSSCQRQFESSERWANILSRNFRPRRSMEHRMTNVLSHGEADNFQLGKKWGKFSLAYQTECASARINQRPYQYALGSLWRLISTDERVNRLANGT